MKKFELIRRLVDDFKKSTPNWKSEDIALLQRKLSFFEIDDLELLCSQIKDEK